MMSSIAQNVFILLTVAIACTLAQNTTPCPPQFTESSDGRFCWFLDTSPKTRNQANLNCEAISTGFTYPDIGLADIHSEEANSEIARFILNAVNDVDTEVWLGGVDPTDEYPLWQWDAGESCPGCNDAVHGIMQGQGCYNFSTDDRDFRIEPLSEIIRLSNVGNHADLPEICVDACSQRSQPGEDNYDIAALRRDDPDESTRYKESYEQFYPSRGPLTIPNENRAQDAATVGGTLCLCGYLRNNYAQYGVANTDHASLLYECKRRCGTSSRLHCGGLEVNYIYRIGPDALLAPWDDGQPNAARFYQNCATSIQRQDFRLGDENCFKGQDYISAVCRVASTNCSAAAHNTRTGTAEARSYFDVGADCAYVIPEVGLDWYEARAACMSHGGDLITLETTNKYEDFRQGMERYVAFDEQDRDYLDFWVAGNAGLWNWRGFASNPITYSNWYPAQEPDDYAFGRNCMVMLASATTTDNYWQARDCSERKASLCQIDRGIQPDVPSTVTPSTEPPSTPAPTTVAPTNAPNTGSTRRVQPATDAPDGPEATTEVNGNGNVTEPGAGASKDNNDDGGLDTIYIILIVVVVVLVIAIIIILIILCCYRQRDKKNKAKVASSYDARPDASYPDDEKIYISPNETGSHRQLIADKDEGIWHTGADRGNTYDHRGKIMIY